MKKIIWGVYLVIYYLIAKHLQIKKCLFGTICVIPMALQKSRSRSTWTIGNDVWIGARVTILGNVGTIGNEVIIEASSVVIKPISDYTIVVGNPAMVIKFWDSHTKYISEI